MDFVTAVNCRYTLGVFTKWDMFQENHSSDDYTEIPTGDINDRCVAEFMTAVSDRGKVFFIDSQTQREAVRCPLQQVTMVRLELTLNSRAVFPIFRIRAEPLISHSYQSNKNFSLLVKEGHEW